jgi:hypothetical protein
MDRQQIGRLALRVEGKFWVAYYALTDTMDGAIELGRIAMAAVTGPDGFERKQMFMSMMRDFVADIIEARCGVRPFYADPDGQPAPEHERSGQA